MPRNLTDMDKYLIERLDRIDNKLEKYFHEQEEKITKLRVHFAATAVVLSLATTLVADRIKAYNAPALPAKRQQLER